MIKNIIKRVIVGVLIALVLSFISSCEVKAIIVRNKDWYETMKRPANADFYAWTSATNRENIANTSTLTNTYGNFPSASPVKVGSYGVSFAFEGDVYYYHDYLYAITEYIASSVPLTIYDSTNSVHIGNSIFQDPLYQATKLTEINCGGFYQANILTKCYMLESIVAPEYSGSWFFGRVKSTSSANAYIYFLGYNIETLGVYSPVTRSFMNDLLDSKGFATQSSVNQVNTNIQNQTTQQHQDAQQTQQKLDDINNTMKDDDTSDVSTDAISSGSSSIATNNVISDLITLPVDLFTAILNSIDAGCFQYNLGSLFGTDLILPCINLENILGSGLYHTIDVLISGLFVYYISRKMIKIFNELSMLEKVRGMD